MKPISDEEIIAALLSNGTLRAAAEAVGLSERGLYDRTKKREFQARYSAAKAEVMREAVARITKQLQSAIDTTAEIMTSEAVNPAVRLQAAQTILNNAVKFAQRLQTDDALTAAQIENNRFFMD